MVWGDDLSWNISKLWELGIKRVVLEGQPNQVGIKLGKPPTYITNW